MNAEFKMGYFIGLMAILSSMLFQSSYFMILKLVALCQIVSLVVFWWMMRWFSPVDILLEAVECSMFSEWCVLEKCLSSYHITILII